MDERKGPKVAKKFTTIEAGTVEEMADLLKQAGPDAAVVLKVGDQYLILAKGKAQEVCTRIPFAHSSFAGGGIASIRVTEVPGNQEYCATLFGAAISPRQISR